MSNSEVVEVLRQLARSRTRFITVADLCGALTLAEEDCQRMLHEFVEQGLLRATKASNGQSYFWLTPQLSQE